MIHLQVFYNFIKCGSTRRIIFSISIFIFSLIPLLLAVHLEPLMPQYPQCGEILYIYIKMELCLLSLYIFPECRSIAESKRLKDILRYPTYPTICFRKWFPYVLLKKWLDMASPSHCRRTPSCKGLEAYIEGC